MSQLSKEQFQQIEAYQEGLLQGDDRLRVEKWLAENTEARAYQLFLKKLASPHVPSSVQPPVDLVAQIMKKVEARQKAPVFSFKWAPVGLAAACVLVLGLMTYQHLFKSVGPLAGSLNFSFKLDAPGASRVEVAGDFSGWKKIDLKKGKDGWEAKIAVTAGRDCQYAFILNEKVMMIDPSNDRVLRDKSGDFYSVLRMEAPHQEEMKMSNSGFLKTTGVLLTALWMGLGPSSAMAAALSPLADHIDHAAQAAGWSTAEIKTLLEKVPLLQAQGLSDKTIEAVVDQTLPLGSGQAMDQSLGRLHLLVSQGLAPEAAGQVVVKESMAEQKASDDEMEKSLVAGLKNGSTSPDEVLTADQIEEKLEQKREEWEEQMEKQDQILSIQNEARQNHTRSTFEP